MSVQGPFIVQPAALPPDLYGCAVVAVSGHVWRVSIASRVSPLHFAGEDMETLEARRVEVARFSDAAPELRGAGPDGGWIIVGRGFWTGARIGAWTGEPISKTVFDALETTIRAVTQVTEKR